MLKYQSGKKIPFNESLFHNILPYLLISLILIPIVIVSRWGALDDWDMLNYLINDATRAQLISSLANSGRFYPLYRIEWDLLSNIAIDPYAFYLLNFIEGLIACYLLYYMLKKYSNKLIGFLLTFILIMSPAFVASFYRLGVPDKNSFFLFIIGLYSIQKYLSSKSEPKRQYATIVIAFLSINFALYFKEPGFILISIFAMVFTFLNYAYNKELYGQIKNKILTILIFSLTSSFIFILLYIITLSITNSNAAIDHNYVTEFNPGNSILQKILLIFKSIIWYIFLDPLIIYLGPLALLLRVTNWEEFMQNITDSSYRLKLFLADSTLIAALFYASFYLATSMMNYHYLLPAYAFFLPAIAIYADILINKKKLNLQIFPKSQTLRKFATLTLSLLLIGSLVTGVNQIIVLKYIPYNMNEFVENSVPIIQSDLHNKSFDDKIDLFLLGVDRKQYVELYYSLPTYLQMRGIDTNMIDIKSVDPIDGSFQTPDSLKKYTAFQSKNTQIPENGDYIIIMPYSRRDENKMIDSLKEQHSIELQCLYQTDNTYFYQMPFPIQIIKQLAKEIGIYESKEIFHLDAGYSLYVVK